MRVSGAAAVLACVLGLSGAVAFAGEQEYDGCKEQAYDSTLEPCGGGHQHASGKRDEVSLERSQHRHRYIEDQIKQLNDKVSKLESEVEQLKKAGAK